MDKYQTPSKLDLNKNEFYVLSKQFNSDLLESFHKTKSTYELAKKICPLAETSLSAVSNAIECIRLPNQYERSIRCVNKSCHLLNKQPISIDVESPKKFNKRSFRLNPVNGDIIPSEPLKIERQENTILENDTTINPNKTISFSNELKNILKLEYSSRFKKAKIRFPQVVTTNFLEENTTFRTIGPINNIKNLPVDDITIDIAGWAYGDACLDPTTLANRSGYTINQTILRTHLVDPIVKDVNADPFPVFRFMEIHKMYEDKL